MKRDKSAAAGKSINRQLYKLLIMVMLPLMAVAVVLLVMLFSFNQEYADSLQNAKIAAEFNHNFKDDLDQDMWYYAIGRRDELPWDRVEDAEKVLYRLQETTTLSNNQWRIQSMLNMSNKLRSYMEEIADTDSYDLRLEQLENNIRSITKLIESYMDDYIYDEVQELTRLQSEINSQVLTTIIVILVVSIFLIAVVAVSALRFTRRITQPINELSKKAKRLGEGDFSVSPIKTNSDELKTLDDGFNEMVGHINSLMEKEKEDQNNLHRAELELLQAQINPHFLYNTLDSIVWLAERGKYSDVIAMVTSLSVFFRTSLSNGQDVITIENERKQVKSYLEIQKIRYNDILEYEIEIPDGLLKHSIPKLTLQPLVENAIYHGTKHKRAIGKIIITGYEEADAIVLTVKDNGVGMSADQLETLRQGIYKECHTGLGLMNVYKRIKLYCGGEYGLLFDSVFGESTTVSVRISKEIKNIS